MCLWMRKYSIVLTDRALQRPTECIFSFAVPGSFADFCRATLLIDRTVQSTAAIPFPGKTTTKKTLGYRLFGWLPF